MGKFANTFSKHRAFLGIFFIKYSQISKLYWLDGENYLFLFSFALRYIAAAEWDVRSSACASYWQ